MKLRGAGRRIGENRRSPGDAILAAAMSFAIITIVNTFNTKFGGINTSLE